MSKLILAAFVMTVCWMTAAQARPMIMSFTCTSVNGGYTECETGVAFTDINMTSEKSANLCVQGSTWGTYGTAIWVNHGCSANFNVTFDDGKPVPAPTPVPVPAPKPPAYEVVDCRFNSVNWQPYYKPTGHYIGRDHFGFQDSGMCVQAVQMARANLVCNWVGNGFTPYEIESNNEIVHASFPTLDACYDAIQ